jgi:hypothetical protein
LRKRHLELTYLRTCLRHRDENIEDLTYNNNVACSTEPTVPIEEDDDESNLEEDAGEIPIVLLDL